MRSASIICRLLQSEMCVVFGETRTGFENLISLAFLIVLNFHNFDHVEAKIITNPTVMRKTCLLKPDPGPCRANLAMYYYDPAVGKCNKFKWGGCQGNGNRFNTREECYDSCYRNDTENQKVRPRYCFLEFDYGYCFGSVPRFYYDHLWKVCKERIYSGCGGNKNNFYSVDQCDSICRFGNGVLHQERERREKRNKVRKVIIINPPSATKRDRNKIPTTAAAGNTES